MASVAARHMLPVEMLCAALSVVMGLIAGYGQGPLWAALQSYDPWLGVEQNTWWGVVLISGGLLLFGVALDELLRGRRYGWNRARLLVSANIRCWTSLALVISYGSLIAALLLTHSWALWGVVVLSGVLAAFLAWAGYLTRRLSVCLDPTKDTPGLDMLIRDGW